MRNPLDYIVKAFSFIREYMVDMLLYVKHNNYSPFEQANRRRYFQLVILSHAIEKGLSLGHSRPMFGRDKIKSILGYARKYDNSFSRFPAGMAKGALAAYYDCNSSHAAKDDPTLESINAYLQSPEVLDIEGVGGIRRLMANQGASANTLGEFLLSRFSCRMFDKSALPRELITHVLEMAQAAPSQCNRQSVRVHFYQDDEAISGLLSLQGGAAGFNEGIGNLFVVSSEITAWGGPKQRNQLYVDGGLFSMMLMLACHAEGIATCPLNLAVMNSTEEKIKKMGGIPTNQRLIMMIAAGNPSESSIKAANSPRCGIDEVAFFH